MKEEKAVLLADEFSEWVGETFRMSARGAKETIRWFIKTLYGKGYRIIKKDNHG